MFDPKLKEALGRVQKPGRYTGGEPGSIYKDCLLYTSDAADDAHSV